MVPGLGDPPPRRKKSTATSNTPTAPTQPPTTTKAASKTTTAKKTDELAPVQCPCLSCQAEVFEGQNAVSCETCLMWVHADCLKMTTTTYNLIKKSNNLRFLCDKCIDEPSDAVSSAPVDLKLQALETKFDDLKANLVKFLGLPETTDDQNDVTTTEPPKLTYAEAAAETAANIQRMPELLVQDMRALDQEERMRRCVVVSGLTEKGTDTEDANQLVRLLDRSAEIKEAFRMGGIAMPKNNKEPPPRLLKIVFGASSVARSVLSQARLLRNNADYPNVFLRRSMTKQERNHEYNLRQDRNTLNLANEPMITGIHYAVSNGELIRFVGCKVSDDGMVSGGTRDRGWIHRPTPRPLPPSGATASSEENESEN